jgi:hypothetical protein
MNYCDALKDTSTCLVQNNRANSYRCYGWVQLAHHQSENFFFPIISAKCFSARQYRDSGLLSLPSGHSWVIKSFIVFVFIISAPVLAFAFDEVTT